MIAGEEHDVGVQALKGHEVVRELPLAPLVKVPLDDRAVRLPTALADLGVEGDHRALDLGEEVVVEGPVGARLKLVKPHVVGVARGVAQGGNLLHGHNDSIEVGLERGPVVLGLGLVPHLVGLGEEPGEGGLLLGWDADESVAVAAEHPHLRPLHGAQERGLRRKPVEEGARSGGAQERLVLLLKDRLCLSAVRGRAGGVDRGTVAVDPDLGIAMGVEVPLEPVQAGQVLLGVAYRRGIGDGGCARDACRCGLPSRLGALHLVDVLEVMHAAGV
jgi:hypothetical protein